MSLKLGKAQMLEIAGMVDIAKGGTIHINHSRCTAGTDLKRRLYITRLDSGVTLFFCHHCGARGALKPTAYTSAMVNPDDLLIKGEIIKSNGSKSEISATVDELAGIYGRYEYPHLATLLKSGIDNIDILVNLAEVWPTFDERDCYGMRVIVDPSYCKGSGGEWIAKAHVRYMLPHFDDAGVIDGLWIRNHRESYSKVLVYGSAKQMLFDTVEEEKNQKDHIFIVEDPISAVKMDCLGHPCFSLGGLSLDMSTASKLAMLYRKAYIWLDNDKASDEVLPDIKRMAELAGFDYVRAVRSHIEPKKLTVSEIREVLSFLSLKLDSPYT